jgi:hypothetical protein
VLFQSKTTSSSRSRRGKKETPPSKRKEREGKEKEREGKEEYSLAGCLTN